MKKKQHRRFTTEEEIIREIDKATLRARKLADEAEVKRDLAGKLVGTIENFRVQGLMDESRKKMVKSRNLIHTRCRKLREALAEFRTLQLPCCVDDGSVEYASLKS